MNTTFATILEIVGTLAFAISGIRLAAAKQFDWFGAYAVGLVTAIGGGTLRDVLLNATPFWMINGSYLTVTAIALIFVIIFKQYLVKLENTFFIFDTIGLALFVVVGVENTHVRISVLGSDRHGNHYGIGRQYHSRYPHQRRTSAIS